MSVKVRRTVASRARKVKQTRAARRARLRRTRTKRRRRRRTTVRRKHNMRGGSRNTSKPCIILFHMNGCGACMSFMSVWKDYVRAHPEQCTKSVELEDIKLMAAQLEQPWMNSIRSFPTIMGVSAKGDRIAEFDGRRTAEALDQFAQSLRG